MKPIVVRNVKIGEGMPKICVPIVGKTKEEITQTAREILKVPADLVEWRVDWFDAVFEMEEVKAVLKDLRKVLGELPLLFTFRTRAEGGEREITYQQYKELLKQVADTGMVDLIDVEVFLDEDVTKLVAELKTTGVKVVGSNHDFEKTPRKEEIIRRLCYMQDMDVDIPKIAVMPQSKEDVMTLISATHDMACRYADRPLISMSMAGLGTVSRAAGEIFGSDVTFGAVKRASAPGQIDVKELKNILEILHHTC